jgi:hypothetical protein
VDLIRFHVSTPADEVDRYRLQIVEGRLVSIATTSVEAKRGELWDPSTAIFAVPGVRQARVLFDSEGKLAGLVEEARDFRWSGIEAKARVLASCELRGYAEEVAKVLGALERRDESAQLYGTLGLILGLPKVVAMARGILIETENSFFREVQHRVGSSSPWSKLHRIGAGFVPGCTLNVRASAGVHLYPETRSIVSTCLEEADSEVIEAACGWIAKASIVDRIELLTHGT